MFDRFPIHLNLHRLAGLSRMVALEFTDQDVRVAELETPGLVHPQGNQRWVERWSERLAFTPESDSDETGARLAQLLRLRNSRATRVRLTLRPKAVRLVRADLPEGDVRVREWIEDHAETLLELPVTARDVVFDFRPAPDEEGGHRVDIGFARHAEIEKLLAVCRSAGLRAVAIGVARTEDKPGAGELEFLPAELCETGETQLWRSLVQRVALASGGLLLLLLLLQSVAALYVDARTSAIDETSQAMEATAREVAVRAFEVGTLEERVAAMRIGTHRSQVARTLHDLASSITPGIRFHALEVQASPERSGTIMVSGEVATHTRLAVYLAVLDTASFCSGVQLLRSGAPKEAWTDEKRAASDAVGFEVRGALR